MSQYVVNCDGYSCVDNAIVYGIEESIKRAKYPMSTDIHTLNSDLTNGIRSLANCEKGTGHDQWLCGIILDFDFTLSVKAWTEAERYNFLTFISSQSTMHRISKFDLDNQYMEYVDKQISDRVKQLVADYNEDPTPEKYLNILYSNPAGFKLTAGMVTNYRQLKTIYAQQKTHRLPEWREFCMWIETLPHSELIIGQEQDNDKT